MTAELSQIIDNVTLSNFAVVTLQPDQQMLSLYGRLAHNAGMPQPLPQQLRVPANVPPRPLLRGQDLCHHQSIQNLPATLPNLTSPSLMPYSRIGMFHSHQHQITHTHTLKYTTARKQTFTMLDGKSTTHNHTVTKLTCLLHPLYLTVGLAVSLPPAITTCYPTPARLI